MILQKHSFSIVSPSTVITDCFSNFQELPNILDWLENYKENALSLYRYVGWMESRKRRKPVQTRKPVLYIFKATFVK